MARNEDYKTHPSWGMISFSRATGGNTNLFGSHVTHSHHIQLRICPGSRKHDLGQDWYHAELTPFIDVQMSVSQFAEAITSLNMGAGVPCTIRYLDGKEVPRPPKEDSESDRTSDYVKRQSIKAGQTIVEAKATISEILARPSVGKKDRELIERLVETISTQMINNLPFYIDQYTEATERVTTKAKMEFEAMVMHHFSKLGVQAAEDLGFLIT